MNYVFLFMLFLGAVENNHRFTLHELRSAFENALKNEQATKTTLLKLKHEGNTPIERAYLGALQALQAKYRANPILKIESAREGLKTLNNAIEDDPKNIECKYLRFIIEFNIPGFLGMSPNLELDKQTLMEYVIKAKDKDEWLRLKSREALLKSKTLSNSELTIIMNTK